MEFGSAILADVYGLETTKDGATFETKRAAIAAKFARVEQALGAGPWFGGDAFSLVDAVLAPVFRYFDLFDRLADRRVFDRLPGSGPRALCWPAAPVYLEPPFRTTRRACAPSSSVTTPIC